MDSNYYLSVFGWTKYILIDSLKLNEYIYIFLKWTFSKMIYYQAIQYVGEFI